MATNMNDIKTIRNKTGAGFADCKKALEESNNDINAAIKLLKEMGVAAAEKRAGRTTSEGSVFVQSQGNKAALLELGCETDFVAKNEIFQQLGKDILQEVFASNLTEANDAIHAKIQEVIGTIKENMELKRLQVIEKSDDEIFATYTHGVPARLGTIVSIKIDNETARTSSEANTFALNCALHAVARIPLFLTPDSITESYKTEQIDIITKQVKQLDKPENVAKGIIQGKWQKHVKEICFVQQPWVHDEKTTVTEEIKKISVALESNVEITNFSVFILGNE